MTLEYIVENNPYELSMKIIARELDRLIQPVTLVYEKLDESVIDPYRKHDTDMCYDLYAHSYPIIEENFVEYKTGLRFNIPEGYDMLIFPRSSISNTGLVLANSVGIADQDYRGEVLVRFKRINDNGLYTKGDRICQVALIRKSNFTIQEGKVSTDTNRGKGGFGSTGK